MILENVPLKDHCYYKIGGPARYFCTPESLEEFNEAIQFAKSNRLNVFVLGLGSNLLIADSGFNGLVIKNSKLNSTFKVLDSNHVEIGSSLTVTSCLREATKKGLSNFECIVGVPGTMGGVIAMNAGTHLGWASGFIEKVTLMNFDYSFTELSKSELSFSYRKNHFLKENQLIYSCLWKVDQKSSEEIQKTVKEVLERRKKSQPLDYPSCGSVFKNPESHIHHAWQVIDKLNLRGHRIGNAQFSEKHSNFIVNLGSASSRDVYQLIQLTKTRALSELGIHLEEEVKFLGSF